MRGTCPYLADNTSIDASSVQSTSLPTDCYSHNDTDLCQAACVNGTDDDVTFELERAHYVTGFTIHVINASDETLVHLSDAGSLAVEYKILASSDYTSATAKVRTFYLTDSLFIIYMYSNTKLTYKYICFKSTVLKLGLGR